ncbi:MAG: hypothetical protein UT12_C0030G0002 [Candidatus Curtissbacteria bacterium GW2011_GWC2_38_9]|uniref:Uncharacterized protein n=1 Tax=Candidatus Curtissbacteria bacterium GW2011_GWC2_38_9 TaxID=1618414 RepID=A0A0G0LAG0_9BACT|nr:MAG: hypothetical protein UT12_C0030G0002 [Candidatus Curtissbacteria bacterium GW2011_GWC2_38_9]
MNDRTDEQLIQEMSKIGELFHQLPDVAVSPYLHAKILAKTTRQAFFVRRTMRYVLPIAAAILLTLGLQNFRALFNNTTSTTHVSEQTTHKTVNAGISLASFGDQEDPIDSMAMDPQLTARDLNPMVMEYMATFKFQQALRLRAKGDYEGVAELLERILKEHPTYSRNADVLTIRIDALFRLGKNYEALQEFSYLKSVDSQRAQILQERWLKN